MRARFAILFFVLALALAPVGSTAQSGTSASPPANPHATGKRLVIRFFTLIMHKDQAGLARFLSPAFQVERADGSGTTKANYLANLATVTKFHIANLVATQAHSVLVVRYLVRAEGMVNGKPYTPGFAPRLSVFSWNGTRWQLLAHANFNPLTG
jgi:hypothetical protein